MFNELSLSYLVETIRQAVSGLGFGAALILLFGYFYSKHLSLQSLIVNYITAPPLWAMKIALVLAFCSEVMQFMYQYYTYHYIYWTDNPELVTRLTLLFLLLVIGLMSQFQKLTALPKYCALACAWVGYFVLGVWVETNMTYVGLVVAFALGTGAVFAVMLGIDRVMTSLKESGSESTEESVPDTGTTTSNFATE